MGDQVAQKFRVAVTADAFDADGEPRFAEMGLEILERTPGVEYRPLGEYRPVLEARQLEGLQGLLVLDGGVDAATLSRSGEFLALSRFGVGYGVAGFRPEVSVGYRTATVDSVTVTKSALPAAALRLVNSALADVSGTVSSIDLAANVYYDIGSGSAFSLYLGVGGGLSLVTVKLDSVAGVDVAPYSDSASALSVQAAAGIGYAIMEDLTLTLGYRLVGTMEANFSKYSTSKAKTGMTLSHTIEAGLRFSF